MVVFDVAEAYNKKRKKEEEKNASSSSTPFNVAETYKLYKHYETLNTDSVNDDYISTFISDVNSFFKGTEETYKGIGWGNASSVYDSTNSTWQDLKQRQDTINAWLYKNKSRLSEDSYKSLTDTMSSIDSSAASILGGFEGAKNFFSQFETEDSYNQWKANEDEKAAIISAEDFEEYSKKGAAIENPSYKDAVGWLEVFGHHVGGKQIQNKVTFMQDENNYQSILMGNDGELANPNLHFMTEDEVNIYNYYLGKGDSEKADKYLSSLEDTLNRRMGGQIAENAQKADLEWLMAINTGLDQFASGVKNLDNFVLGTEADPISPTQYAGAEIRENIESDFWRGAWDLGVTVSNQLPSILVGTLTGSVGGLVTMGTSVAGNSYAEMRNLGYNEWQARGYSALVTAAETGLQSVLGGISSLGGSKSLSKMAIKAIDSVDNAIGRVALKIGTSMVSEGIEEATQSVLEPIFKSIFTGEFEGIDWGEVAYSGLLGALSAGFLESGSTIASDVSTTKAGQAVQNVGAVDRLTKLGSTFSADSVAYKLAGKVGENTGAYTIGRLLNEVGATLTEQNQSEIIKALERQGIRTKDAKSLTKWLYKAVEGEYFTDKQIAIIENNDVLAKTIADVIINPNSTVNQRMQGYAEAINMVKSGAGIAKSATTANTATAATETDEFETEEAETVNPPSETKAVKESQFSHSDDGKTTLIETGEEVSVKEISSIKNGAVTVRLEDGREVNAKDVSFSTQDEALMVEMVADLGVSPATAMSMMNTYAKGKGAVSMVDYRTDAPLAYKYGTIEYTKGLANLKLTEDQKITLFGLGRTDAMTKIKADQANVDERKSTVSKTEKVKKKSGKVTYLDGAKPTGSKQESAVKLIEVLSESIGNNWYVFSSYVENGKRVYKDKDGGVKPAPNGKYDTATGDIYIDLNAGQNGEGLMIFTMAHELTHFIRQWSPAKFKVFADFLIEQYGEKGISVDGLIQKKIARAESNGRELSYDNAYEEVIADSCETMLRDSNAIEAIAKLKAKDRTVWEKIKNFISDLVAKIKSAYAKLNPDSIEGRMALEMKEVAEKLQSMWTEALVDAGETYSAIGETLSNNGIMVNTETESASLYSVRDLLDSKQQQQVAKALAERFDVTVEEAKDWISAETSLASLILNPKYSQYLDYTADPNEVAIKQNSDYPQGTVDFSPICAKRREFTSVMNNILRLFPNHVFAATDLAKIRSIMQEEGMTVPCGICYIEDRRQLDALVAQDFIDSLKLYREGSETRPDGKPFNTNQLKGLKLIDGDNYTPSVYELVSLEGLNVLKEKNPNMADAWVKFNNARGMQSVRLLANEAEYKRQILKYNKQTVKSKNDKGGLRVYSFSDAEMFHLIDIIQVITDSATVGLSLQGYTKVNEYAKAVKDTGEKLNRSLIPKGKLGYHLEDGKVVLDYDTVEGIDINHPDFFDNRNNPNVGNITIGVSDVQIRKAMVSDFVDQIIPFHTGQSEEVLGEKGISTWSNYKDFQTEKDIATGKVSDHQINIYTEVLQVLESEGKPITKRTFVEKFLQVCMENNLTPRFSQFLNTNEKGEYIYTEGYHKMLVDFKTFAQTEVGEYLPQKPVKPIFDDKYITKILKDYVKAQKVKDAELAKSMPKVIERITNEIVKPNDTKFSDRDSAGNQLTENQAEYFKDSKVRDSKGRLQVVYHGTTSEFNTFKRGDIGYHFGSYAQARNRLSYQGGKKRYIKAYLDIKNPFVVEHDSGSWHGNYAAGMLLAWGNFNSNPEAVEKLQEIAKMYDTRKSDVELKNFFKSLGYDGVQYLNTHESDFGKESYSYIAFDSNQVKEVTNLNPTENPDIRYSDRVTDKETLDFLENQEHVTVYRAMQLIDGKLYPPMNAYTKDENGNKVLVTPSEIGTWEQSVERPDLIDPKTGKFKLDKGKVDGGKQGTVVPAAYNPYIHTSLSMLNDQFTSAYQRSNLVVVKGVVPKSELTSGYKAQYAKDSVGETEWHSGVVSTQLPESRKVILSRWFKPVEVMDNDVVAKNIKKMLGNTGIEIPYNVVSPKLRRSLEKIGVPIGEGRGIRNLPKKNEVKYSDRDLAPTFYSQMGKVIEGMKQDKFAANSVVSMLRGRGVKTEEIRWSGIATWLEDKKSVTKAELLEFIAGSQLQISKQMPGDDIDLRYNAGNRSYTLYDNGGNVIDTYTYNELIEGYVSELDDKDSVLHEGQVLYSDRYTNAEENSEILAMVERVKRGNYKDNEKLFLGNVTDKVADEILTVTEIDVRGFKVAIEARQINHILKRHGENGKSDHSMANPSDIAKMEFVINNHDDISEAGQTLTYKQMLNGKTRASKTVLYEARIGEKSYYVVQAIPDTKAKTLYIVTAFIGKSGYKKEASQIINAKNLDETAKTESANASNNSISQKTTFVNSFSENSEKFSDRDPDSVSNRSLLANALESAAQNDIEKNKLKQYKEKIYLIEAEEAKLHELNEQIHDILFTKGARDSAKLRNLQFEKNQTANRINTYDRQLLTLEASKPLKDVLEREKQLAYKKAEQKGKDALAAYREKTAKTTRELMTRYQESRAKATEGRHKTEMRHKIKDVVSKLNQLLLRPTKDKHIKEELRGAVAEALSAINMDTIGAEERVAKYNDLIAKTSDPDMIAELTKTRDRIELQGETLKEKLTALQTAYEKVKNSSDDDLKNAYQEPVMNAIKNVVNMVGNTSIMDMNLTQLEAVYEMYTMILHTVRTANKAFKAEKGETITQLSEAVNVEVRKISKEKFARSPIAAALRKTGWTLLKPLTAFRTVGSDTFTELYNNLRSGEDTFYEDINEAKGFIQEKYKKYNFKSWDNKQTKTFTAKSGKTFTLTLEQMMSLYAYSRRQQAYDHIIEGGIVLEDSVIETKNKLGLPVKYKVDTKSAFNISEETLQEICDSLTKEQKAFVDDMQAYLSDVMGAKGNEVSMELLGVKLFKEKFYFPLKSSKYYMGFKPEEAGEIKLKNPAFSKETVQHANNPVVLKNFTDVWATHINDMSMYHAFVLPLEDFTRVYNYKTKTAANVETMSTEATIANAYGEGATQYIRNFLKSLNGGVRIDGVGVADKFTNLAKKGAVLGSASVAIQQPSAIMRAMAEVNPIHFVASTHKSVNLLKHKKDWAELKQYAPIAGIKEMGRFDVGMGQTTVKWIKDQNTVLEKADEALGKAPAFMDEVTWLSIWNAVKSEVKHKNKGLAVGSEAYLKKCGERFTEVVSLTQVYDSVFSRSDLMRNANPIAKMLTVFMAEPSTTLNMFVDSWIQGKRTGKFGGFLKTTAGTTGAIVASIVFNAALKSIITAMRDDDEDESYAEKYIGAFIGNTTDNINPLTYIPFVKDVVSIFKGYDVERMDMALFSDLKNAIDAFDSDSKTEYEKWSGLTGAIAAFFGVPFKNVERDIRGAYNTIKSFSEGEQTTDAGIDVAIKEALTGKDVPNKQQLYEAYISGNQQQIERVEGRFEDRKAIETALRSALQENDSRIHEAAQARLDGDIAGYTRIAREIISEGNFVQDIVVGAINAEINAIKRGQAQEEGATEESSDDEVTSIYKSSDINAALESGDTALAKEIIEELIEAKIANGKDEKSAKSSLKSSLTSYWKPLYKQAYMDKDNAEMTRIRKILRASGLYGSTDDVVKTCQNWLKDN